jgi:hypothetical protein
MRLLISYAPVGSWRDRSATVISARPVISAQPVISARPMMSDRHDERSAQRTIEQRP